MSKIFGGGRSDVAEDFEPQRFRGGGLFVQGVGQGEQLRVRTSAGRQRRVGELAGRFGQAAAGFRGLREQVAPGFSRLRENVRGAFQRRGGELRESFARRRLAGSQFAAEAQGRLAAEESQELNRVFLQELEASSQLLQLETANSVQEVQTFLNELNLQTDLAARFSGQINTSLTELNALEAELNAQSQSGIGEFFGGIAGLTLGPAGAAIGSRIGRAVEGGGQRRPVIGARPGRPF